MRAAALALGVVAACGGTRGAARAPAASPCGGALVVTRQDQLAAMAACRRWDGDLTIRGGATFDLGAIAALDEVTGDLVVGPTFDLDLVELGVVRVGGALRVVSNGLATGVFLPRLERAGELEIAANVAIAGVSAPRLREVAGAVILQDNPVLERVDAPDLATIGGAVEVDDNPALDAVESPALRAGAPEVGR